MTIRDKINRQLEGEGMMGGKGKWAGCTLFGEEMLPSVLLFYAVSEPGEYAGYHRHEEHDSVIYVLSGTAEHYQEGERCTLGPGEAVLVKARHPHTCRNAGHDPLEVLEFVFYPERDHPWGESITTLPLPEDLADWQ